MTNKELADIHFKNALELVSWADTKASKVVDAQAILAASSLAQTHLILSEMYRQRPGKVEADDTTGLATN
jgi:hypothetical protein